MSKTWRKEFMTVIPKGMDIWEETLTAYIEWVARQRFPQNILTLLCAFKEATEVAKKDSNRTEEIYIWTYV